MSSSITFTAPQSVQEACTLLSDGPSDAKLISGGTALVLMMGQGLVAPGSLISIARLPELQGVVRTTSGVRIGAATTLAEVASSPLVRTHAPSLAHACSLVGNQRVRNVATLGGNLAEADYASDPPSVLASLGATCQLVGSIASRSVQVSDLITGFYETVLQPDEVITQIDVPEGEGRDAVYLKYRTRSSEDRACVGVAACVDFVDGRVGRIDVVVAAVASTLQRVPELLASMSGRPLDETVARSVARGYADAIHPMDDARGSAAYRSKMIEVFVRRALLLLVKRSLMAEGSQRG